MRMTVLAQGLLNQLVKPSSTAHWDLSGLGGKRLAVREFNPMARRSMNEQNDHEAMDAFQEKAGELGEDLSEVATLAADVGREKLGKVRDAAVKSYEDAKDQLVTWEDALKSCVQQKPIKSLLIAAGFGMFISMILRRR